MGLPDGWLRYVVPSETDVNRSRWEVHPDWQVVQYAFTPPVVEESDHEREEREKEELLQEVDVYLEEHPLKKRKHKKHLVKKQKPAFEAPGVDPLLFNLAPFIRVRKRNMNMRRMVAQVTGCLETFEAWRVRSAERVADGVETDLSDTLSAYYQLAMEYMDEKKRDYSQRVHKKRVVYHIPESVA